MSTQSITLNVPDPLYHQIQRRAERSQRSVEEETLEALAKAVGDEESLPAELAEAIESLAMLDDANLWAVARKTLAQEVCVKLETLHDQRQREGLSEEEAEALRGLVRQYERHMLLRAQAAALLRQRGHDVGDLANR